MNTVCNEIDVRNNICKNIAKRDIPGLDKLRDMLHEKSKTLKSIGKKSLNKLKPLGENVIKKMKLPKTPTATATPTITPETSQ